MEALSWVPSPLKETGEEGITVKRKGVYHHWRMQSFYIVYLIHFPGKESCKLTLFVEIPLKNSILSVS